MVAGLGKRTAIPLTLFWLLVLALSGWSFASPCEEAAGRNGFGEPPRDVPGSFGSVRTSEGNNHIAQLIRHGEANRVLGNLANAESDFKAALEFARSEKQPVLEVIAARSLGSILFLRNDVKQAEAILRLALDRSCALDRPLLEAGCANTLGGVLVSRGAKAEAEHLYTEALKQALKSNDSGLEAAIRRNLARILKNDKDATAELAAARKAADRVPSALERAELLLSIAAEAKNRRPGADGVAFRHALLRDAYNVSSTGAGDNSPELNHAMARSHSIAAGQMGALYQEQGRIREAVDLTQQAVAGSQALRAPELLLQWERQLGGLLEMQGDEKRAIDAYRRAVIHIEAIRLDIPIEYQDGKSSFGETLAPVYYSLADLLLRQSISEKNEERRQGLLREARDTVEKIKQSELQDYFRDRCIASRSHQVEKLSPSTAVLYPIILRDRLELLVGIGGRLHHKTIPVKGVKLKETASSLANALRNGSPYKARALEMHAWIIGPIQSILDEQLVDTIVFVPDGPLRLMPLGSLFDGEKHLIQRYAVVVTPGLTLLDPAPVPRKEMAALLAGVSRPGPVVNHLPTKLRSALELSATNPDGRNVRGQSIAADQLQPDSRSIEPAPPGNPDMTQICDLLALPGVKLEIDELSRMLRGQTLLDREFGLDQFTKEVSANSYRIVHIASHGYFGGAPEQSFILTYDRLLDMNKLEELIKPRQFAEKPVEIITLSACQTAEGNDRSPLGLTGIALKSGARSALGSLWPVSDDATRELLPDFYAQLSDGGTTKAEALRMAQLRLMNNPKFQHPFFWAPFILVGNWL